MDNIKSNFCPICNIYMPSKVNLLVGKSGKLYHRWETIPESDKPFKESTYIHGCISITNHNPK